MMQASSRIIYGLIYVSIILFCILFSKLTFHLLFIILSSIAIYELLILRKNKHKLFPFLIVITPLILAHFISQELIFLMFILTWTFDTMAYFIGSKFGKHKLSEISPNKSWEGLVGGTISTYLISFMIVPDVFNYFDMVYYLEILFIIIILPFTATLGDLNISYYKRLAKVKDTGRLIPGHGGILDRIDSILYTTPIIYILDKFYLQHIYNL